MGETFQPSAYRFLIHQCQLTNPYKASFFLVLFTYITFQISCCAWCITHRFGIPRNCQQWQVQMSGLPHLTFRSRLEILDLRFKLLKFCNQLEWLWVKKNGRSVIRVISANELGVIWSLISLHLSSLRMQTQKLRLTGLRYSRAWMTRVGSLSTNKLKA